MPTMPISERLQGLGVAHLEEYFGAWAIEPERFSGMVEHANAAGIEAHVQAARGRQMDGASDYDITDDGVAVIELSGTMMKQQSSFGGASTVAARRQIRAAVASSAVRAIVLHIDSPGGTVSGTPDLAADVAEAAAKKPVMAFIEDLGASAAYWVASQASKVFANRNALVGSIGTFAVIQDMSGAAGQMGIKVHVIRAGSFKGAGVPGTVVTDAQLSEMQRTVDSLNALFLEGVSTGRRMDPEKVSALADGRVHIAAEAKKLGLIDGVKSFDQVLREAARSTGPAGARAEDSHTPAAEAAVESTPAMEGTQMPDTPAAAEPRAATYPELKAALVGADPAFIVAQLDAGSTLDQARSAWMAEQQSRIAAAQQQANEAKAAGAKTGAPPLTTTTKTASAPAGDAIATWNERVAAEVKAGRSRADAVRRVSAADPDLHQAFIGAYNELHAPARKPRR